MVDYRLIGTRIKEKRMLANYSQEQLAWEANLSATFISYIETGTKKASLESLISICNVLGTTIDELLTGNQEHNEHEYINDIYSIMLGLSKNERRLVYEQICATVSILRKNKWEVVSENDK